METTRIFYSKNEDTFFLFVHGEARFSIADKLQSAFDIFVKYKNLTKFVIDLTACNIIDSTCLGVLAKNGMRVFKMTKNYPQVYANNEMIINILKDMSLDKIFMINEVALNKRMFEGEINLSENTDDKEVKKVIIDAHKCLSSLSEQNAKKFRNLIEVLENDIYEK